MHKKEQHVAAAFAEELGAKVIAPEGINTDLFGTFTGEVARTLSPAEAAAAKARLGMRATNLPYGLASEATYSLWYGTMPVHEEILVFLDDTRGIEVVEGIRKPGAQGPSQRVGRDEDPVAAAQNFGFPAQGAAVTAIVNERLRVFGKGVTDISVLLATVQAALNAADSGRATIEPDLRAQFNPSRCKVIAGLARKLAVRLATDCPVCHTPGYGRLEARSGLRCGSCASPTTLIAADVYGCVACEHRHLVPRSAPAASPQFCDRCNP